MSGCQKLGLVKEYEYDERVELSLDGSAVVDVNAQFQRWSRFGGDARR
jgi:hypothetical protein